MRKRFSALWAPRVDGPSARGFLRFLSLTALRAEGCGIAAFGGDEFYMPPLAAALPEAAKTVQPGLRPVGNAPLLPTAPPPEGEVYSPLLLVLT